MVVVLQTSFWKGIELIKKQLVGTWSALVQVMTWCVRQQTSTHNLNQNQFRTFLSIKFIQKCCLQNSGHFVAAPTCCFVIIYIVMKATSQVITRRTPRTYYQIHEISCYGNDFHITGSLWRVSIGHRWIPITKWPVTRSLFLLMW